MSKPSDTDVIYYSELNEFFTTNAFRSFSIKFVLDQCIYYKVEGKEYGVKAGNYLLACKHGDVKAYFDNRHLVRSICIDVCPQTLAEAFTILSSRNEALDEYLDGYFHYPEFFETLSSVHDTSLGKKLRLLAAGISNDTDVSINKEWFFDLAEHIVYQEYGNYLILNTIESVRPATRKELLRRLQEAKAFIDLNFLQITEIKEIASHCSMSEYHFFRRFKQVYKRTPYQYITEKKMHLAKEMLVSGKHKIADIASLCNFPDIFTFSKSFKRFFGLPPSKAR